VAEGFSLKHFLPRGLFGRSLIIIVAPIVLLQAIIAYVFFERDLDSTTRRLARDVAADIALLVALEDEHQGEQREMLRALASRQLAYRIRFLPGQNLPPFHGQLTSTIDVALDDILEQRIGTDRDFRTARVDDCKHFGMLQTHGFLLQLATKPRIRGQCAERFGRLHLILGNGVLQISQCNIDRLDSSGRLFCEHQCQIGNISSRLFQSIRTKLQDGRDQ